MLPVVAALILFGAALAAGALDAILPRGAPSLCQVGGTVTGCGRVTGIVLSVDGPSLAAVEGFSLRTVYGEVLEFTVERFELADGGGTGPHLREHQLDGLPIEVEYKVEGGQLVALRYTDAQ